MSHSKGGTGWGADSGSGAGGEKLAVLNVPDFNLIANKNPIGSYDRKTRENLNGVIEKLRGDPSRLSSLEKQLLQKFGNARFRGLEEKEKRVKMEVARYRRSRGAKRSLKVFATGLMVLLIGGWAVYQFGLSAQTRQHLDMAYHSVLRQVGLVARKDFEMVRQDLTAASSELAKSRQNNRELSHRMEQMIRNNRVAENFEHILKQIYLDPGTKYVKRKGQVTLKFNGQRVASYKTDPGLWYILGAIDTGAIRVYYENQKILEIDAIFGRQGEETPTGEYRIVNKVHKPTWYKKETRAGNTHIRAIPFGDPEHDIGRWWLGLKKVGSALRGSYGIHGVNLQKANDFFKKNFDWRNGSAGCPNIQGWYLQFLAKVVPVGVHVNIVQKDKWKADPKRKPPSAA